MRRRTAAWRPRPRPEDQLLARQWEVRLPALRQELRPVGTGEDKPLIPTSIYAITKRDHEEIASSSARAYGIPTVALRFFNIYGPGQALSNPYTGVAAIFASRLLNESRRSFSRTDSSRATSSTSATSSRGIVRSLSSQEAEGKAINLGTGRPTNVTEIAEVLADGLGVDDRPGVAGAVPLRRHPPLLRGPIAGAAGSGLRGQMSLPTGMENLLEWLEGQEAVDRVDSATRELAARGLTR